MSIAASMTAGTVCTTDRRGDISKGAQRALPANARAAKMRTSPASIHQATSLDPSRNSALMRSNPTSRAARYASVSTGGHQRPTPDDRALSGRQRD